jgi:hypothetical protein
MDAARAGTLYTKLIQQGSAEDAAMKERVTGKDPKPGAFNRFSNALADAVDARADDLKPFIDAGDQQGRFVQLNTFLMAVEAERGGMALTEAEYMTALIRWNLWFKRKQLKFNMPPIKPADALAIITEIHAASWQDDAGFKAYCAAVDDPHRAVFDMRKVFATAGLAVTYVYTVMHFLHQHTLPIDSLNEKTATDIHHLSGKMPPLTAFAGYADWGPGNNGSIPLNKANHFLKHVLDAHPAEDLPWQGECAVWWEALDIKLTRADAEARMSGTLFNAVKTHFPAEATGRLPFAKVEAVIGAVKSGGGWPALLQQQLVTGYADAYVAYALNLSRSMTNIIVHTDAGAGRILVKGLHGKFYLGGRIDGSTLGLSTCFVPIPTTNLVDLHLARKVWQVSPI